MSYATRAALVTAARELAQSGTLPDPSDEDIIVYVFEAAGDASTDLTKITPELRAHIIRIYDKYASA